MKKFTDKINESVDGNNLPTAYQFLTNFTDEPDDDTIYKAMIEFAKLHVEAALKEASESRCIDMYGKTWFSQSLEPGTKVLDTINITIDKDSILNSYPLDNIK